MRKKNYTYLITTLLLLMILTQGYSQSWKSKRYDLFYGAGVLNFNGDVGATAEQHIWVKFFETISPTANIGLRYKFNDRNSATSTLYLGQMYAKDHDKGGYPERGLSFNSFFTELGGRYEFNIIKEKRKRTIYRQFGESGVKNINIPTYLFVGFAGTFNIGSFKQESGRDIVKENYTNFAPVLMYGIGAKYRVTQKSYIGAELNVRLAFSDKLDNAWNNPESKIPFGTWFDQYQSLTFNYVHQIRSTRNGMPNFRRRGAAAKTGRKSR